MGGGGVKVRFSRTLDRYDLRPVARWPWRRIVKIAWPGPINTSATPRSLPRWFTPLSPFHAIFLARLLARSLASSGAVSPSFSPFSGARTRPLPLSVQFQGNPLPHSRTPLSARENTHACTHARTRMRHTQKRINSLALLS